jgi:hypothetical protein
MPTEMVSLTIATPATATPATTTKSLLPPEAPLENHIPIIHIIRTAEGYRIRSSIVPTETTSEPHSRPPSVSPPSAVPIDELIPQPSLPPDAADLTIHALSRRKRKRAAERPDSGSNTGEAKEHWDRQLRSRK